MNSTNAILSEIKNIDAPSPKVGRRIVIRNSAISKASFFLAGTKTRTIQNVELKLAEQFRYFRQEFIDCATHSGVTVPLDILEDNTGRIFNFVKHNGPKYMFQIMQSNLDHTHLLRCSLSLLIITMTILRRRLPITAGGCKPLGWMMTMIDKINDWATESVNHIAGGVAVSVLINMLIYTHVPSIQELALSLLSILVTLSEEAAMQMFELPNTQNKRSFGGVRHRADITPIITPTRRLPTRLFNVSNIMDSLSSSPSVRDMSRRLSRASSFRFDASPSSSLPMSRKPSLMPFEMTKQPSKPSLLESFTTTGIKTQTALENDDDDDEEAIPILPGSCLSLMLSVACLYRNRHSIMSCCADVMSGMCNKDNPNRICEAIAKSTTCDIRSNTKGDSSTKPLTNTSSSSSNNNNKNKNGKNNSSKSKSMMDWAGLKLLLKFLTRYMRFSKIIPNATSAQYISSVEQEELAFSYSKVLIAISNLIVGSPVVMEYATVRLRNVLDIVIAAKNHCSDLTEDNLLLIKACESKLRVVKVSDGGGAPGNAGSTPVQVGPGAGAGGGGMSRKGSSSSSTVGNRSRKGSNSVIPYSSTSRKSSTNTNTNTNASMQALNGNTRSRKESFDSEGSDEDNNFNVNSSNPEGNLNLSNLFSTNDNNNFNEHSSISRNNSFLSLSKQSNGGGGGGGLNLNELETLEEEEDSTHDSLSQVDISDSVIVPIIPNINTGVQYKSKVLKSSSAPQTSRPIHVTPTLVKNIPMTNKLMESWNNKNERMRPHSVYTIQNGGVYELSIPAPARGPGQGPGQGRSTESRPLTAPAHGNHSSNSGTKALTNPLMKVQPGRSQSSSLKSRMKELKNVSEAMEEEYYYNNNSSEQMSFSKTMFSSLPAVPKMPPRLEPQSVIQSHPAEFFSPQTLDSVKSFTETVINKLDQKGAWNTDGIFTISIEERARRIYDPAIPIPSTSKSRASSANNFKKSNKNSNRNSNSVENFRHEEFFKSASPLIAGLKLEEEIFYDNPKLMEEMRPIYNMTGWKEEDLNSYYSNTGGGNQSIQSSLDNDGNSVESFHNEIIGLRDYNNNNFNSNDFYQSSFDGNQFFDEESNENGPESESRIDNDLGHENGIIDVVPQVDSKSAKHLPQAIKMGKKTESLSNMSKEQKNIMNNLSEAMDFQFS